jgi:hypothetical protein
MFGASPSLTHCAYHAAFLSGSQGGRPLFSGISLAARPGECALQDFWQTRSDLLWSNRSSFMADQGLRARVERLLGGEFRSDDLTRLFLAVRGRCGGRESVQDVGDFVAHHDKRDRGVTTQSVQEWFAIARFVVTHFVFPPSPGDNLPAIFPRYLLATHRRMQRSFKADQRAQKPPPILLGIIDKLDRHPDGTFSINPTRYSEMERNLIQTLCSAMIVQPAFSGDELYNDFSATLIDHALLRKTEIADFEKLKAAIVLYAVAIMHRSMIEIDRTLAIQINAVGRPGESIEVDCGIPLEVPKGNGQITILSAIFSTNLDAESHCEPALLSPAAPWDFELEVTPNLRLGKLA